MSAAWPVVCATGHRDVDNEEWTRTELGRCAAWLREHGTRAGWCGMARGVDLWWGEALLAAGLHLWAAIPFAEQAARWTRADRSLRERLLAGAARIHTVGVIPDGAPARQRSTMVNRMLHTRNTFMIDHSVAVVAVWDGRLHGGAHGALLTAARKRRPGVRLDPTVRQIRFQLPGLADLLTYALHHDRCGCVAAVGVQAQMEELRLERQRAGQFGWRLRRATPRESPTAGCPTCTTTTEITVPPLKRGQP